MKSQKCTGRNPWHLKRRNKSVTSAELRSDIEEVRRYCLVDILDAEWLQRRRNEALKKLSGIIRRLPSQEIESIPPGDLVYCARKLMIYFHDKDNFCDWCKKRQYKISKTCFRELLKLLVPKTGDEVTAAVIDTIEGEQAWLKQALCVELLQIMYEYQIHGATIAHAIWNKTEKPDTDVNSVRAMIAVLCEVFDSHNWPESTNTIVAFDRLLGLYRNEILRRESEAEEASESLKKGFEVCVRRMLEHLLETQLLVPVERLCSWSIDNSASKEVILEFGNFLEYAASMHRVKLYENTLTPEILPDLMRMIASPSRIVSLLGNRIMQYLFDRNENKNQFDTPRIFFENTIFNLKLSQYERRDEVFLKSHREEFHDSLVKSIVNHCNQRHNLETTYCTICLIAIEIPCGFTAAAIVCLAMNLQDIIMERTDIEREATYHVHATIMSIVSILCWIHRAKDFYRYMNKIMMERARWAPHLNLPLQSRYTFAAHHVLRNKPELFFVDWEIRYGLWKCFRSTDI